MFLLRAVLNILVSNASPGGPMCFKCLIFSLSGPCELLCLLCFIAFWKLNSCLSDIRRWMITNKLKNNDSKT